MLRTTVGQLMINQALPPSMRNYQRAIDSKGLKELGTEIAIKHPEKYREIMKKLTDVGQDVAYTMGGLSFDLNDMSPTKGSRRIRDGLLRKIEAELDSGDDEDNKEAKILKTVSDARKELEDGIFDESVGEGNPLALQILSGARGNRSNLRSIRGADLLYSDHRDRVIPVPILRSYAEGLSPAEYYAGTFGARKGLVGTKLGVADAGFFAKQLVQATHRLLIDGEDDDAPSDERRGLPIDTDDMDSAGALLARPTGRYPRNTVITPKMLRELQNSGVKRILIRSPMVGGPESGGVWAKDVGLREKGGLAPSGDYVGIAAAQAIAERVSQTSLGSKHTSGVLGSRSLTGFKLLNSLIQAPKTFKGGAVHAQADGRVQRVEAAPQGGHYIYVNDEQHYIPEGYEMKVKPGDEVEAGDIMTDGTPIPAEINKHKGIGEGRRYFMDTFREAYADSGMKGNRRNIELIARGLINHVRLTDEMGDYVPDDIVPYHAVEHRYEPREGTQKLDVRNAAGKYLERPVLHYSIGTKIRPSVIKQLQTFGINDIDAHDDPPPFEPVMVRAMDNLQYDPEWMPRMLGSNLQKGLLNSVHRGASTDEAGTSFVPGLARAVEFGHAGKTKSWRLEDVKPIPSALEGL